MQSNTDPPRMVAVVVGSVAFGKGFPMTAKVAKKTEPVKRGRGRAGEYRPYFRRHDGWWYVLLAKGTKPVKLVHGKDHEEQAIAEWHKKMAVIPDKEKQDSNSVGSICDLFISKHQPPKLKKKRYDGFVSLLKDFCRHYGKRPICELTEDDITNFLEGEHYWKPAKSSTIKTVFWNETGRWKQGKALGQVFRWAITKKFITHNPMVGIKLPSPLVRIFYFTEEQKQQILESSKAKTNQALYNFIFACFETGARPFSEIAKITTKNVVLWKDNNGVEKCYWDMFDQHKTAHHSKKRYIHLSKAMVALTKELMEKNPSGPLFRTSRNKVYSCNGSANRIFSRLVGQFLKLDPRYNLYACRHTFATLKLKGGKPLSQVATWLGNTMATCEKHYGHLAQEFDYLSTGLDD